MATSDTRTVTEMSTESILPDHLKPLVGHYIVQKGAVNDYGFTTYYIGHVNEDGVLLVETVYNEDEAVKRCIELENARS